MTTKKATTKPKHTLPETELEQLLGDHVRVELPDVQPLLVEIRSSELGRIVGGPVDDPVQVQPEAGVGADGILAILVLCESAA